MSDAEVATSAVRLTMRRIRGKQPSPDAFITVAPLPVKIGESTESFVPPIFKQTDADDFFQELYHKHGIEVLKHRLVDRNKMRTMIRAAFLIHHRAYAETFLTSRRCPQSIKENARGLGHKLSLCADRLFAELNHLQRVELFRKMIIRCQDQKLDDTLLDILTFLYKRDYRIACIESDDSRFWLNTKHALLTYNGKWGIIDHSCYKGLMKHPQLLCKALRKNTQVIAIHEDLKELAEEAKKQLHLAHYTIATELCETTLEEESIIRVHCHLMLESGFAGRLRVQNPELLAFRGSLPIKSASTLCATIGTSSCNSAAAGHYYNLMPKFSSIFSGGTVKRFINFRVNPDHIMAFVQSKKMSVEDAKMEILQTFKDSEKHIRTLEYVTLKLDEIQRSQKITKRCMDLQRNRFPRRYIPIVDDEFVPHVLLMKDRHKFLVLDGPSQVGKTTFCKQLTRHPDKEYVEIDCSSLQTAPNFHVLTDSTSVICWDEVGPQYVCDFRKIFQGPEKAVNLGDTQSARFAYTVDLWGIKMVCCSNNWVAKVEKMSQADQDYIHLNCFYHYCDQPLWVDPSLEDASNGTKVQGVSGCNSKSGTRPAGPSASPLSSFLFVASFKPMSFLARYVRELFHLHFVVQSFFKAHDLL